MPQHSASPVIAAESRPARALVFFDRWKVAIAAHVAVIVAWQLWVTLGDVPTYVMPSQLETLAALCK